LLSGGISLEKIVLWAKWDLKNLEDREEELIKEARSVIRKLLKAAQTKLQTGKALILGEIEVKGKRTVCILTKERIVWRETESRQIIDTGTIKDLIGAKWFSVGLAKSILSNIIHYELHLEDQ